MTKTRVLSSEHPDRGTLYAAVDPGVRFIVGGVRESRFAARLAPFADEASARQALEGAGKPLAEAAR
jgi:hypothetical protein